jgi:hypothetical protein
MVVPKKLERIGDKERWGKVEQWGTLLNEVESKDINSERRLERAVKSLRREKTEPTRMNN